MNGRMSARARDTAHGAPIILTLPHFPAIETLPTATPFGLLGNGTACLVWSSSLVGNARHPMRYIDLMGWQYDGVGYELE